MLYERFPKLEYKIPEPEILVSRVRLRAKKGILFGHGPI